MPVISRRERLIRLVAAEDKGDKVELALLAGATPKKYYALPDTTMSHMMLQLMSLMYVTEQLEFAGMYLRFLCGSLSEEGGEDRDSLEVAAMQAYLFKVNRDGWEQFAKDLGVSSETLIGGNYNGDLMEMCSARLCELAPTPEGMVELFKKRGLETTVEKMKKAEAHRKSWHNLLNKVLNS